jgi:hypothetical protein
VGQSQRRGTDGPRSDWSQYDLAEMSLRVLSGRRPSFSQRRPGLVALASDIDDDASVAAVWPVRHPGSLDSAQHTLEFELARSLIDRERLAGGLGMAGAGWVACAGFRLAAEVGAASGQGRPIPVPGHGYAIVAWRSPPALARPPIVAVGKDGSQLSELGPHDFLDSLTREGIERALLADPLPGPGRPDAGWPDTHDFSRPGSQPAVLQTIAPCQAHSV